MRDFIDRYLDTICTALRETAHESVEAIIGILTTAYENGNTIFIAGNGGSAGTASHLACDLSKTTLGADPRSKTRRFKVLSLSDNVPLMTAWANDEGYEHIFSEPLKNFSAEGDVLIVISASGNSPNIVNALKTARALKLRTFGLLGFGGGKAKELAESSLVVESRDYGCVEGVHSVLAHLITSRLCRNQP